MDIDASKYSFSELNERIRAADGSCHITGCVGQRFIGAGMGSGHSILIDGIPGNALGAYCNGARITVNGNAQDAVGDTMNDGSIVVHGSIGDAAGYAMRGGAIYVQGDAGYRAGIHMKEYREKKPALIIGGRAGSFLGEYQAGGLIVVLGLYDRDAHGGKPIVGNFPCTGMHGGKMALRGDAAGVKFPAQVTVRRADAADLAELRPYIERFGALFGYDAAALLEDEYTIVTPNGKNPYRQMYVAN